MFLQQAGDAGAAAHCHVVIGSGDSPANCVARIFIIHLSTQDIVELSLTTPPVFSSEYALIMHHADIALICIMVENGPWSMHSPSHL